MKSSKLSESKDLPSSLIIQEKKLKTIVISKYLRDRRIIYKKIMVCDFLQCDTKHNSFTLIVRDLEI